MQPKIWWVNHKQTVRQEIEGGYLWSPKRNSNNAVNQFYENMRMACPGDLVVSYAHAKISYYGTVTNWPISAPKPESFGKAGENWSNDGWLVPVRWIPLPVPFRPKHHINRIRPLLPERYAPIRESGDGNQGAYLCRIDDLLLEELVRIGNFDPRNHVADIDMADDAQIIDKIEDTIQKIEDTIQANIEANDTIDQTEKDSVIKARKGQGVFRRKVERIQSCCRVTGLSDPRLLIASHIKPWRLCKTSAERLDGDNGLLLAPHIDRLFDRGLITFEYGGKVDVSSTLDDEVIGCLGLEAALEQGVAKFTRYQDAYLGYHRDRIFLP